MSDLFYRYRSCETLFRFKELEDQTIFFAGLSKLNDPMEGFKNVVWQGDRIVWENFLKNYIISLCNTMLLISDQQEVLLTWEDVPIVWDEAMAQQAYFKEKIQPLVSICQESASFKMWISLLADGRKYDRIEMEYLLGVFHYALVRALEGLLSGHTVEDVATKLEENLKTLRTIFDSKFFVEVKVQDPGMSSVAVSTLNEFLRTNALVAWKNATEIQDINYRQLAIGFPSMYLKQIEKLVYPDYGVASFTSSHTNNAMWSHYGRNHTGICLIFKKELDSEKPAGITLLAVNGSNASRGGPTQPSYGKIFYELQEVKYDNVFPEIDFFRSLGRMTIPASSLMWYRDGDGNLSQCSSLIYSQSEEWINSYWSLLKRCSTIKLKDWGYEKEWRLVRNDSMIGPNLDGHFTLKYEYNSLQGIVFGMNIDPENKRRIFEIVMAKNKEVGRKDFKFYQAHFVPGRNQLEAVQIIFPFS